MGNLLARMEHDSKIKKQDVAYVNSLSSLTLNDCVLIGEKWNVENFIQINQKTYINSLFLGAIFSKNHDLIVHLVSRGYKPESYTKKLAFMKNMAHLLP